MDAQTGKFGQSRGSMHADARVVSFCLTSGVSAPRFPPPPPPPRLLHRLHEDKREQVLPEGSGRDKNVLRHASGADCKGQAIIMTKFFSNRSKKQTIGS